MGDNGHMRRIGLLTAWVAATFATALTAWSAVNLAGNQVADRPVLPLSSAEVEALPISPVAPTTAVPTTTPVTAVSPPPPTTTTLPSATTTVPATTTPPATTTSTTTTSTLAAAAPEVSAYNLVGGVVTVEAASGQVSLVSASPYAGFSVEVKASGPGVVEVEFESEAHESTFRARWDGQLVVSTEEDPEDDDADD